MLAAAQTRDKSAVNAEQLKEICDTLKETNDFVLVDCPAGIEQGFQNAVAGASEAIVVTTPEVIQSALAKTLKLSPQNQHKILVKTGSLTQISYFDGWSSVIYSDYTPL